MVGRIDVDGKSHGFHTVLVLRVSDEYERCSLDFASPEVFRRLVDRSVARDRDSLRKFVVSSAGEPSLAILRGRAVEGCAHELLPHGGKFRMRRLYVDKRADDPVEKDLPVTTGVTPIPLGTRLKEQIGTAQDNTYLKPVSQRFPAFDAIVTPSLGYQVTINVNHVINLLGYLAVRQALKLKDEQILTLFIVTTPDRFFQFSKAMPFSHSKKVVAAADAPQNVEQWVVELPFAGMTPFKDMNEFVAKHQALLDSKMQDEGEKDGLDHGDEASSKKQKTDTPATCCRCTLEKGTCKGCRCFREQAGCVDCLPGQQSRCSNEWNDY